MNEIVFMILAFVAGLVIGTIFFGGLWFTVKKGITSKKPTLLFFFSFVLRTGIALIGFYYISQNIWQRFLICLVGFVIARFIIALITKPIMEKQIMLKKEAQDEA